MDESFNVKLERVQGYEFHATFHDEAIERFLMDEPAPLGKDAGLTASQTLAVAVGDRLGARHLLCVQKSRLKVKDLRTNVEVTS